MSVQHKTWLVKLPYILFLTLWFGGILLGCGRDVSSASESTTSSSPAVQDVQPTSNPLPTNRYPPATPIAPDVILGEITYGCPNRQGIAETTEPPTTDMVVQVLTDLKAEDLITRQQVADPAYWPGIETVSGRDSPTTTDNPTTAEERITPPEPAQNSPYAGLLATACGEDIIQKTWWVQVCPGPCTEAAQAPSLIGHFYLIQRDGQWFVWAIE